MCFISFSVRKHIFYWQILFESSTPLGWFLVRNYDIEQEKKKRKIPREKEKERERERKRGWKKGRERERKKEKESERKIMKEWKKERVRERGRERERKKERASERVWECVNFKCTAIDDIKKRIAERTKGFLKDRVWVRRLEEALTQVHHL